MFELEGGMDEIGMVYILKFIFIASQHSYRKRKFIRLLFITARIWDELGQSHKTRNLPKQSFLDMRQVILDYLARIMQLNDSNKQAYAVLIDWVYDIFFSKQYN